MEEFKTRQELFRCIDDCSILSVDKIEGDNYQHLTIYKMFCNNGFVSRLKTAINILLNRDVLIGEIVLTDDEFDKLRKF